MPPPLRWILLAAAAVPALGLLLAALAPAGWLPARLALHWAPHLALLSLPLLCWQGRRWQVALPLLALGALALWPRLEQVWAPRAAAPAAATATVAVANLYEYAPSHAASLRVLDGDLAALVECMPADREVLRGDARWPYQRWILPRDYSGLALLSRWPMRVEEGSFQHGPSLDARIQAPWGPIRVIALHARTPVSERNQAWHDDQMAHLAALAHDEPGPLLVLGDFNASLADPSLRQLQDAGLRAPADGDPATWPSWFGSCGIGIDHVFVRRLALAGAGAIDLPGSDHRGLRAVFGPL